MLALANNTYAHYVPGNSLNEMYIKTDKNPSSYGSTEIKLPRDSSSCPLEEKTLLLVSPAIIPELQQKPPNWKSVYGGSRD